MTILIAGQQEQLDRVAEQGRHLAEAKATVRQATEAVQDAVFDALDAGVPVSRVAKAAGVHRSLIYQWLDRIEHE